MNFYCLLKVFHFIGKFAQLAVLQDGHAPTPGAKLYSILVNLFFVGDLLKSGNPGFNEVHLLARKLDLEKLQQHNSLIQMGLQRKIKLTEYLSNLIKKNKAKIMSSNSK